MAKIKFYFDEMVSRPLANELDVEMTEKSDPEHLQFASQQGAVMVTLDQRFAGETSSQIEPHHAGLICWTPEFQNIGSMLKALINFVEENLPEDVTGKVFWLR